ncbi:MAG: lysophospholipid acyltransferase family protein [Clostridia bacterium]|nr:lysophospholipid acyltransferase family protein [Clostridia bacterium]
MLLRLLKVILYVFLWIMYPTIYKGKKNIPKGKVIFISNHTSNADPIIVEMSAWKEKFYLVKKELYKNKFIGGFWKRMNTIPIDRGKTDLSAIKAALKVLNRGKSLVIFPEGTRNKTGEELGAVKSGAAMLAIKAKSPIVPIWIKKKPRLFCPNSLRYGKPFTLEQFYDKKLDSEVLNQAGKIIAEKLLENKY